MGGESYEVVVLGAAEATPAATARLSAQLARSHGLPVAAVVRALHEKNLRIAEGLDRPSADALVQQLQSLGALTTLRRSTVAMVGVGGGAGGAGAAGQPSIPTPLHGFPALGAPGGNTLPGLGTVPGGGGRAAAGGLTPLGGSGMRLQPLPMPAPAPSGGMGLRPLGASQGAAPLPAPVQPARFPTGMNMEVPSSISSFALAETPRGGGGDNPFTVPEAAEQALELDVKPRGETRAAPHPSHSLAGASALNTSKIVNTNSASGLSLSSDAGQEDTIRCPAHGLLYDRRKFAGCRRCLEAKKGDKGAGADRAGGARKAGNASRARKPGWSSTVTPTKRAFLGLLLALGVGFGAAAYYTLGPVATQVGRLRAEQTALSGRPGTQENLARFDRIDVDVGLARSRGLRNSLVLWVAASGLLMAAWYKATA